MDPEQERCFLVLIKNAWRRGRTFVLLRVVLVLAALALASLASGCAGTWDLAGHPGPKVRTAIAGTDVALLMEDALQSRWMVNHYHVPGPYGGGVFETNPMLGRYPSKLAVTAYCGAWIAAVVAGRLYLPRWAQWALLGSTLAVETWTVEDDYRMGERPAW